jgi:ethanolamine utilization protein EutN
MRLAVVLGQVVSTAKQPGLANFTLLLVRDVSDADIDAAGEAVYVAVDLIGAGAGEVVLVACGGAARVAAGTHAPTDLAVVAIVDTVSRDGVVTYQKA